MNIIMVGTAGSVPKKWIYSGLALQGLYLDNEYIRGWHCRFCTEAMNIHVVGTAGSVPKK
jgi:hypothetical protein